MKKKFLLLFVWSNVLFSHEILIFHHIPKCAGTTLSSLIGQKFHVDEIYLSHAINNVTIRELDLSHFDHNKIRFICGHVPYWENAIVLNAKHITFLRDPIERVFSHYRYFKDNGNSGSFYEFYEKICNLQVNYLSTLSKDDLDITLADHLQSAKENLAKAFDFVGIVEEMELSIKLLYRYLGWEDLTIIPVFGYTIDNDHCDAEFFDFVKQSEWADLELYEYGKVLFEKFKENAPPAILENPPRIKQVHLSLDQPLDGEGWGYREIDLANNVFIRHSYLEEAFIRFPLIKNNYVLDILAYSPSPKNNLLQLTILVNGNEINMSNEVEAPWTRFKGNIPSLFINNDKTKITFKFPEIYVPSNHHNVPDHRHLGIGIIEINIYPKEI